LAGAVQCCARFFSVFARNGNADFLSFESGLALSIEQRTSAPNITQGELQWLT